MIWYVKRDPWYGTVPVYCQYISNIVMLPFPKRQLLLDLPQSNYLTAAIALLISIFPYITVVVALHASLQRCDQIFKYISLLIGDFELPLQAFNGLEYVVAKVVSRGS
jgi:hypothetical protein